MLVYLKISSSSNAETHKDKNVERRRLIRSNEKIKEVTENISPNVSVTHITCHDGNNENMEPTGKITTDLRNSLAHQLSKNELKLKAKKKQKEN